MSTARLKTIGRTICAALGCPSAELSFLLTDDAAIRALNRRWRGKDAATDVLSFSQLEHAPAAAVPGYIAGTRRSRVIDPRLLGRAPVLGDVIVSVETAARQAPRYGHGFAEEIERLLVHGVLHLLGHDHVHGGLQARRMRREEARLLRALRGYGGEERPQARRRPATRRSR